MAKVYTPRGVEALRAHPIGYVPGRQDVRVERARVWKPDGTVVETHQEADRSTSEPWYRLYYDTRVRQVVVPALAPGDVLELAWRVDDVAGENLLSDYFGEVVPFADHGPQGADGLRAARPGLAHHPRQRSGAPRSVTYR